MNITLERKIAHGGNPVLRWMMDNIYVKTDPAGNIKPDKEKSTEKIDGAVALIMALVKPEKVSEDQMVIMARDVAKRVENEMEYPGQIKVNVIRETRAIEYAK